MEEEIFALCLKDTQKFARHEARKSMEVPRVLEADSGAGGGLGGAEELRRGQILRGVCVFSFLSAWKPHCACSLAQGLAVAGPWEVFIEPP